MPQNSLSPGDIVQQTRASSCIGMYRMRLVARTVDHESMKILAAAVCCRCSRVLPASIPIKSVDDIINLYLEKVAKSIPKTLGLRCPG